jgi:hypothetical protein
MTKLFEIIIKHYNAKILSLSGFKTKYVFVYLLEIIFIDAKIKISLSISKK